MKRFLGEKENDYIKISNDEFFHLKKVLRMKEGDQLIAIINDENDYYCTISQMNKDYCICNIDKVEKNLANPQKDITLFQMLPKKEYLDSIVPKSIELGIKNLFFFTSQWTMIKTIKQERLSSQILTACKQCERSKLIKANPLLKFNDMINMLDEFDLVLLPYENESVENIFKPEILKDKNKIAVIVGNEAGFADNEAEIIKNKGAVSISLGQRILRCDTAATAVLSLVSILTKN